MYIGFNAIGKDEAENFTIHPKEDGTVYFFMSDESFEEMPRVLGMTLSPDDVERLAKYLLERDRPYLENSNG